MRALVAYAHSFGIEVLPEIDVPGHGLYLLDRLPQVRCEKDGEKIGIWDMCVASEETYRCIDLLVGELTEIFSCEYIHLGGDELSFYDMEGSGYWPNWYECDRCRALAEREGYTSASDYYCHFVRRVYDIVKKHGRQADDLERFRRHLQVARPAARYPHPFLARRLRNARPARGLQHAALPRRGLPRRQFLL